MENRLPNLMVVNILFFILFGTSRYSIGWGENNPCEFNRKLESFQRKGHCYGLGLTLLKLFVVTHREI